MPALAELEQAWLQARADAGYRGELDGAAARLRRAPDAALPRAAAVRARWAGPIYLKREDLNHTGSHKLNNALGQALLAKRMGKRRIIAETGAGQHGVATATVCALLGPRMRRLHGRARTRAASGPTCSAWNCSARRVRAGGRRARRRSRRRPRRRSATGSRTCESTHYVIGSVVGPAPYPALVRDLQRVIGDEARAQMLEREGTAAGARGRVRRRRLERDRHRSRRSSTTSRSS